MKNNIFNDLFIFEMANNHQGSVEHGLAIIKAMGAIVRELGVKAGVKLQYRDLDTFIHTDHVHSEANKHISRFLSTRMSSDQFFNLVRAIEDEGMISICTPFDEPSVAQLVSHNVQIIKVASCSANDWPLLEVISKAGKPVICSTGGLPISKIDKIVNFFTHRGVNFALMHCVGVYPAQNEHIHAAFIGKLRRRYPQVTIGYSGHEAPDNHDVAKVAVAQGARILERHVGVETGEVKLNAYSMNPSQVEQWIRSVMATKAILGSADKEITAEETASLDSLKRGVFAARAINKGEQLGQGSVFFAIPLQPGQMDVFEYHQSATATKDYASGEPVTDKRGGREKIDFIREIIHNTKGMFAEAGIVPGKDARVHISHHYGLFDFYKYGAVLVDLVNRSYCKKLIVVFPGQQHPTHMHKIKEETFHVLSGELKVKINDKDDYTLKAGDSLLLEPNSRHSFSSGIGAIFEEISTTHIPGDSYYDDPKINQMDQLERKTVVEDMI